MSFHTLLPDPHAPGESAPQKVAWSTNRSAFQPFSPQDFHIHAVYKCFCLFLNGKYYTSPTHTHTHNKLVLITFEIKESMQKS